MKVLPGHEMEITKIHSQGTLRSHENVKTRVLDKVEVVFVHFCEKV
jgi:hypothetical protein